MSFSSQFTKLSAIFSVLAQLGPVIGSSIQLVEAALPIPAAGKMKLDFVLGQVQSAFGLIEQTVVTFEQIVPQLTATIGLLVQTLNLAGLFHHAPPAPAP